MSEKTTSTDIAKGILGGYILIKFLPLWIILAVIGFFSGLWIVVGIIALVIWLVGSLLKRFGPVALIPIVIVAIVVYMCVAIAPAVKFGLKLTTDTTQTTQTTQTVAQKSVPALKIQGKMVTTTQINATIKEYLRVGDKASARAWCSYAAKYLPNKADRQSYLDWMRSIK